MPRSEIGQCSNCLETYDTKYLQDIPLKDIKDFQLVPHMPFQRYSQFDENDPNFPFVSSINVDNQDIEDPNFKIIRSSQDQRVQFIRVNGS